MATLEEFLKAGRLGPISLGMGPVEVMTAVGEPDETSKKTNLLTIKYGPVQLVFWSKPKQRNQDLREILLSYKPSFKKLPKPLRLSDWNYSSAPSESDFLAYLKRIDFHPVHTVTGESETQLIFISGVVALFAAKLLNSIRLSQREVKEAEQITVSDQREPSEAQIREMLREADRATEAGAHRSALMIAWAGLEAALRRAVLRAGGQGRVGVQPAVLLRELFSAKELTSDEYHVLENLRQIRTAAAHGLALRRIDTKTVAQIKAIAQRLLGPSLRKRKEVGYISPVEAVNAFSVLANNKHCKPLAEYLCSKGLKVHIEKNAIGGDDPRHDIQIQKDIAFDEIVRLIDEWKDQYQQK